MDVYETMSVTEESNPELSESSSVQLRTLERLDWEATFGLPISRRRAAESDTGSQATHIFADCWAWEKTSRSDAGDTRTYIVVTNDRAYFSRPISDQFPTNLSAQERGLYHFLQAPLPVDYRCADEKKLSI
jgi:hypothetical protein